MQDDCNILAGTEVALRMESRETLAQRLLDQAEDADGKSSALLREAAQRIKELEAERDDFRERWHNEGDSRASYQIRLAAAEQEIVDILIDVDAGMPHAEILRAHRQEE